MYTLGQILRKRRKERGLSLVKLGKVSGLHHAHIARLERGQRFPTGRTLRKLAKPLGFSELQLLKAAGFISQEGLDEVFDDVKRTIRDTMNTALDSIPGKFDLLEGGDR